MNSAEFCYCTGDISQLILLVQFQKAQSRSRAVCAEHPARGCSGAACHKARAPRLCGSVAPPSRPWPRSWSGLAHAVVLLRRSWLNRRQIDGCLNRTPAGFYDRVWQILERTPNGLIVAGKFLPQVKLRDAQSGLLT